MRGSRFSLRFIDALIRLVNRWLERGAIISMDNLYIRVFNLICFSSCIRSRIIVLRFVFEVCSQFLIADFSRVLSSRADLEILFFSFFFFCFFNTQFLVHGFYDQGGWIVLICGGNWLEIKFGINIRK